MRSQVLIFALAVLVALAGCTTDASTAEEQPKMGVVLPLTGDYTFIADSMRPAIEMAIDDVNAAGGIHGQPLEYVVADSQSKETHAADAVRKLIQVDNVPVIIGPQASITVAAGIPVARDNQITLIAPTATSAELDEIEDDGYFFRSIAPSHLSGQELARIALDQGYEQAVIMTRSGAYGIGMADEFEKVFTGSGGEIEKRIVYDPKASTFDSEIESVRQTESKLVALFASSEEGVVITRQIYKAGLFDDREWLASEFFQRDGLAEDVGKDVDGQYIIDHAFTGVGIDEDDNGPAYDRFRRRYVEDYDEEDLTWFTPNGYDAVALAALAMERADELTGTTLRDNIRAVANPPGTEVTSIREGLELLRNGQEVNYHGASNEILINDVGNVNTTAYEQFYWEDGELVYGDSVLAEN